MPLHVCLFGSGQRALIIIRLFPFHLLQFTGLILCFIGADAGTWILIRD